MLAPALRRPAAAALVPVVLAWHLGAPVPLAAGATRAGADRPLALLVVPAPDIAPRAASTLRAAAVRAFAAAGVAVPAGAAAPAPDTASVEALRAGLAAGRAAYEALDATAARDRLAAVTAALEADGRLVTASPELLDAPLYLGVVSLGLGDHEGARDAFRRAIRLAPDRALAAGRFSPAVEDAYAMARIQLATVRPELLRIDAAPDGADLFVDGVHRGRTPLAIEPLPRGRHLLVALAPSGGAVTHAVDATEFGPDVLHLVLPAGAAAPSLVGLARALLEDTAPAAIPPASARNLADLVGADRLLLVSVAGAVSGFHASAGLLDLRTGAWIGHGPVGEAGEAALLGERLAAWTEAPPAPVDLSGAARQSALLPEWRAAPPPAAASGAAAGDLELHALLAPPAAGPETRPGDTPWYRRWYWWALIGAGVALAAGAAASGGGGGGGGTGSVSVAP